MFDNILDRYSFDTMQYFVNSNRFFTSSIVKTLLSRNFCQKSARENFHYFHTVQLFARVNCDDFHTVSYAKNECTEIPYSQKVDQFQYSLSLEMIQIYGDIFEKVVPQDPLPIYHKNEIFIFPAESKVHACFQWQPY